MKPNNNQINIDFSISKLYMWRCVITLAHADGLIHEDERKYLTTIFQNMREKAGLSEENYILLISDLSDPQDPIEMLKYINEPRYRSQIVYFARLLAYKDGNIHPSEQELLDKLHAHVTDGLNMDEIRKEVHSNVQNDITLHEVKMDSLRPEDGLSWAIDELALFFGIDLMD